MGWGDVDLFRRTFRTVCGDIQLENLEEHFYLTDKANHDEGLVGKVEKVGWGHGKIVVRSFRTADVNEVPTWSVVDCRSKAVVGPLSDQQFAQLGEVRDIQVVAAAQAWKGLPN
jgi:hypothetical protein